MYFEIALWFEHSMAPLGSELNKMIQQKIQMATSGAREFKKAPRYLLLCSSKFSMSKKKLKIHHVSSGTRAAISGHLKKSYLNYKLTSP